MKKCEHFKDLILTDYIDGELDKHSTSMLESHLLDCSDCRAFLKEVKHNAALPFGQVQPHPVPVELWDTIRHNIEEQSQELGPWESFVEGLKGLIVLPKMVPVFASLVLMLLVGSVSLNTIQVHQAQAQDQGEYLVSLLSPTSASAASDNNDSGTPIEHYFL